ncbi:SMC-Scp complex subunit ScpB [candidate division WOR-3 bacterium]|nr:SMC-Scp complex subunit ScpB [candidate division WOR-3 bacterium]
MNGSNNKQILEALLIATDVPLPEQKIIAITQLSPDKIKLFVDELNAEYRSSGRAFEIKEIAGGYQIYTLPAFALWVGALHDKKSKLSKAALETIAIVAYHQPITRPEIEKLRGVDSSGVIDTLIQKGLIKTCGRLPVPGRPIKYGTTKEFLRYFGIKDISDLPREEDFGARVALETSLETSAEPEPADESNNGDEPVEESVDDRAIEPPAGDGDESDNDDDLEDM